MVQNFFAPQSNVMILACSGGSNVGQLSNQAAIELTQEGLGKMFCLAGIGGNLSGFVQSAKDIDQMVAIDGCKVGCAKAILEQAGVPLQEYVVVTDSGIEKDKNFSLKAEEIAKVKSAVLDACGTGAPVAADQTSKTIGCCG